MSMMLRRQMMRKAGDWRDLYQQVTYLESTGTQWIDTGYVPNLETEFYADFAFTLVSSGYFGPGGYAGSGANLQLSSNNRGKSVYTGFGNKSDVSYQGTTDEWLSRTTVSISKTGVISNGVQKLTYSNVTYGSANYGIALFARRNANGNTERLVSMRLYECIIRESDAAVRDLIPCYRKSDNEPGLYDTVSGTFYTNAGTGEFVVGPDVTPEGYIKDGLVLWLDGIDKGDNSSLWPDKCGSYDFTLSNCTFGTNGVVFNGSTSRGSNNGGFGVSISSATIEYCIDMDADNGDFTNGCVLSPTQTNNRYNIGAEVRYEDESHLFGQTAIDFRSGDGYRALPLSSLSNKIIFSASVSASSSSEHVNTGINMFNGISGTWGNPSTFTPNNSDTETTIGARHRTTMNQKWNMIFKGTIYAIRIYNRQLTAAEMLHNQRIDNARFNLGLTI